MCGTVVLHETRNSLALLDEIAKQSWGSAVQSAAAVTTPCAHAVVSTNLLYYCTRAAAGIAAKTSTSSCSKQKVAVLFFEKRNDTLPCIAFFEKQAWDKLNIIISKVCYTFHWRASDKTNSKPESLRSAKSSGFSCGEKYMGVVIHLMAMLVNKRTSSSSGSWYGVIMFSSSICLRVVKTDYYYYSFFFGLLAACDNCHDGIAFLEVGYVFRADIKTR